MVYYLWLFYICLLLLNLLGSLAYFIASVQEGVSNNSGVNFGLAILYVILFTPCSFVCWYRPLYKAFSPLMPTGPNQGFVRSGGARAKASMSLFEDIFRTGAHTCEHFSAWIGLLFLNVTGCLAEFIANTDAYTVLLLLNVIGSLGYFIASTSKSESNASAVTFGVSLLYLGLFTPCSFVCWYRPLYKAFRSDSSFNFFVFFFIFFFQFCVTILMCLGIDGWGTCGFINGLGMVSKGRGGPVTVGIILLLLGLVFAFTALVDMILLIKVHRIYRSTGASFEKAQAEFAQGVMSNKNVQSAAASAGQAAAQGAFNAGTGGNRY